jgi:ubiquinone/menaquinone biosynthesis C-methylase UbiE
VGESDLHTLLDCLGATLGDASVVVEIGCGVGRQTRAIAPQVDEVLALDVSERMLEIARRENPSLKNVRWLLGDGSSLAGISDEAADACLSHVVFQHVPDHAVTLSYIRAMGRVLRPGGWAGFQVSNDLDLHRPPRLSTRVWRGFRAAAGRGPHGEIAAPWLGSAVSIPDLWAAAQDGGMRLERIWREGSQSCVVLAQKP